MVRRGGGRNVCAFPPRNRFHHHPPGARVQRLNGAALSVVVMLARMMTAILTVLMDRVFHRRTVSCGNVTTDNHRNTFLNCCSPDDIHGEIP